MEATQTEKTSKIEAKYRTIFERVADQENWKLRTKVLTVSSKREAERIAKALTFFTGGAEVVHAPFFRTYQVYSKGYYYYIGA